MTFDSIIAVGIVIAAALYLYRKFAKTSKKSGCGCSSEGGCCGAQNSMHHSNGCISKQ